MSGTPAGRGGVGAAVSARAERDPERVPERVAEARGLLARAGVAATVTAAGTDGEIAAVRGAPSLREDLMRLAPEIRALGFRYVALELDPLE